MSKILSVITFLSIIISFISFNKIAFADIPNIDIIQDPEPVSVNDKTLTITVKSKDGSEIFAAPKYSFAVWKNTLDPKPGDSCTKSNLKGVLSVPLKTSPSEISATWDITGCETIGDTWHFSLWTGDSWVERNNPGNRIVSDYPFSFTQPGGTFVTITAKNPVVYSGQDPIVILTNAVAGNTYTFWWDGAYGIAKNITIGKDDPKPLEVKFPNPPTDQPTRKLCMEYGNYPLPPPLNDCNPFVIFNFQTAQPPPPLSAITCTVIPAPNPAIPINSDVNIKIDNIANGTSVGAYATDSKGGTFDVSTGMAEITNSVVLNLLKKAAAESYTATVFNGADGSKICTPEPTFKVGGIAGGPPPTTPPCTDPKKCTSGGGDPCDTGDNRGPAFKTAIGCIHTNPAEFAKDLMTWVIGIGGGIAFLMMLLGAFQMLTSAGNPDTLRAGRERLTSAVIGLLIVVFAVLLLQIIGVRILNIPGFS